MLFTDLVWWQYGLVLLVCTHLTVLSVTIYLHRCATHGALQLRAPLSHFFRFWSWFTTGMITREWVAVHRKHHAKVDREEDPHSPWWYGLLRVLFFGVFLYRRAALDPKVIEDYGYGTPDDGIERQVYSRHATAGVLLYLFTLVLLFGALWGPVFWFTNVAWIPFWAAGVVNGLGHSFGYRNHDTPDKSRNIFPISIFLCGEALHNNHHERQGSAKFSHRWFECDFGYFYIFAFKLVGLAHSVRK